jgi:ABC-type lipoprotein release transport system permease subunit
VALALLVGLSGGVVIAAVAGASRTDSSMRRFVAYSQPEDVYVVVNGPRTDFAPGGGIAGPPPNITPEQAQQYLASVSADRDKLVHLPQVLDAGRAPYMFMAPDKAGEQVGGINPFAAADAHAFRTVDRPLVLRGRMARLDHADEAVVDDVTARVRHLQVGSHVTLYSYSAQQNGNAAVGGFSAIPAPAGAAYTFRIVGIVRDPTTVQVPPATVVGDAVYEGAGGMVLTPAFLRRFADDQRQPIETLPGIEGFRIRLRHGLADFTAFSRQLPALHVTPQDVHTGSDVQQAAQKSQRAIHVEAIALLLFAALAGAAAVLIVGQALAREVNADTADGRTLAAMGLRRRDLFAVPMVRAGLIATAGGLVAVAVAVAASPLTPIGLARRAEIDPGVYVNVSALTLGFLAVVVLTLGRAALPAWRAARVLPEGALAQAPARPGPLTAVIASSGLGPAAVAGVGLSFERGRGIAFRTALLGALVAVAGVVAAITFGVSLHHLVDSPRQQGWNWDVVVGNPNTQPYEGDPAADPLHKQMVEKLTANRFVSAFAGFGGIDGLTVDGRNVGLAGIERVKGAISPTVVEGRDVATDDEITLGRDTLRQLHRRVGQTVTLRFGDQSRQLRIVGVTLSPTAGNMSAKLGSGGAVTLAALRSVAPETPVLQFFVRFRPGVNHTEAIHSLLGQFGREVLTPYPGGEVGDLARVDYLPYVLAGLLVVLAVGALGLTLLNSVRRHRHDLAVLKTIGFVRPQVSAIVAWQATILAVGALVIGVPGGIALGRWTWRLVASNAGSVSPAVVPLAAVLLVIPATLVVANLLAGGPAWAAGRVQPARVLKAE